MTTSNETTERAWNTLCKEHAAFCDWVNTFHPAATEHLTAWNGFQAGYQAARASLPPPIQVAPSEATSGGEAKKLALNTRHPDCHKAADAFWSYWKDNGETHKHGYYESTWGAINRAIRMVGVVEHSYPAEKKGNTQ